MKRTARFLTIAAISSPGGDVQTTRGVLEGLITEECRGERGFGYDPVFLVPELGKTLAELTGGEKNLISHRAKAFAKIRELLCGHLVNVE